MGRVDDDSPRAHVDAAVELCGVDLILACECAASRETRATAIQNDGTRAPGGATSTPRPTH